MYKPSAQNKVAHTLSRIHCISLSISQIDFILKLKHQLTKDGSFQQLVHNIQTNPDNHKDFHISNKLVFHKGKFSIPHDSPFKQLLLEEFYAS